MSMQRRELVDALVDDTVKGYEGLVSRAVMKQLRSALQDSLEAHPVMDELVDEHVARIPVENSGEQRRDGAPMATPEKKDGKSSG